MTSPITKIESDVLHSTLRRLAEAGMTTEDAKWLRKGDNAEGLVRFIRMSDLENVNYFTVKVVYSYDSRDGFYQWERHSSCVDIDETNGEREFALVEVPKRFLGKLIDKSLDALADHFAGKGYRFAIEPEAVAFGKENPDLQRENLILAPGSASDGGSIFFLAEGCDDRVHDHYVEYRLRDYNRLLLVKQPA